MRIELPKSVLNTAHARAEAGGYSSVTDYVCELIRADHLKKFRDDFEQKLIQAMESGERTLSTPERWDALRKDVMARHAKRNQQSG